MAEALLEIVVENLHTFVLEELATWWGADSDIQKLSSYLTAIRAVLRDADDEKQITSHAVKDWLQKLSDAALVLDDILEECSIESNLVRYEQENSGMCLIRLIKDGFQLQNWHFLRTRMIRFMLLHGHQILAGKLFTKFKRYVNHIALTGIKMLDCGNNDD